MKYRKLPVVIDAVHYDDTALAWREAVDFLGSDFAASEHRNVGFCIAVRTLEGPIWASPGDYIIRGVNGEHYPCKPDIFEKTYEAVVD